MEENFIRIYENVLDNDFIDYLVNYVNQKNTYRRRKTKVVTDNQICLEAFFSDVAAEIDSKLIPILSEYFDEFPHLTSIEKEWLSGSTVLQKTEPSEGYHQFHCENNGWDETKRSLVWMIYLNDVEEGGETEFLYQKLRIKPRKNRAVIWPGSFTHLHRGLPPLIGTKYILTGWFTPATRMRKFKIADNQEIWS